MDNRYNLTEIADGKYRCVDNDTTLVCTFTKGDFRESQEMHFEAMPDDLLSVTKIIGDMTQHIIEHHLDLVAPIEDQPYPVRRMIGDKIKFARFDRGLSLRQVAEASKLHINVVRRIEEGESNYTIDNLIRVASAIGLKLFDLGD